ncbi:MAG: hypothetical protein JWM43_652 [Acidobacteriaceae bacterium]|nr:hypothetical protein [Acidobacteriaceae bacterium]
MNPYRQTPIARPASHVKVGLALACALLVLSLNPAARAADKKAPPFKPATEYPANDTHAAEHVTIAIDPCDSQKDCEFFRLPYVNHSLIPIRIIITNDGDSALMMDDARFQFISANNDKIPAADLEEINRRMFTFKSTQGTKIPLIPLTIHHPPVDKKITDDDRDFGFPSTTVKPHTTLAGYLFYDIKNLEDPALPHSEIYIKMLQIEPDKSGNKHQLFAFTIPLDKWLAARPKPEKH